VKGPQSADAPPIYDLYGVSHHSGGMGGGHYTAICKNPLNNNWLVGSLIIVNALYFIWMAFYRYSFNDSFVSPSSAAAAVNELAYVLFYRRRNGDLKWAGIEPLEQGLPDEG
jgi:ubiquitin carboxyl-terminal hydrolase 4/11/15